MAYTPTEWQTGDVVTAEKLNKMENGISNSGILYMPLMHNVETDVYSINKSYNDIVDLVENGQIPYIIVEEEGLKFIVLLTAYRELAMSIGYMVQFITIDTTYTLFSTDPDVPMTSEQPELPK